MKSFVVFLAGASMAAAAVPSRNIERSVLLASLVEREICGTISGEPGPGSCAEACGAGFQACMSFVTCFNPTVGESCCSDGNYCPKGTYCTDQGCCDNGLTLEECGATNSLSTVSGIAASSTQSSSTQSSTQTSVTTTASSVSSDSTISSVSSVTVTTPEGPASYTPPVTGYGNSTTTVGPTGTVGSTTATSSQPVETLPGIGAGSQLSVAGWLVGFAGAAALFV